MPLPDDDDGRAVIGLTAFCQKCGLMFESDLITMSGDNYDFSITGVVDICPKPGCGGRAPAISGRFSTIDGMLHVLDGSRFTREQVAAANRLRAEVRKRALQDPNGEVPEAFINAVEAISPGFAGAWKLFKGKQEGWAWLLVILTLALQQCNGGGLTIDNSTHTETHYHLEGSSEAQQTGEHEDPGDSDSAGDGSEAEQGPREPGDDPGFGKKSLPHASSFRLALLNTTFRTPVQMPSSPAPSTRLPARGLQL